MANTYTLISSVTVGSGGAASISFSSIPATYTDLVLRVSGRESGSGGGDGFSISFNGSTSSFTRKQLYGTGSATGSISGSDGVIGLVDGTSETANTFASTDTYIPNYTGANYKSSSNDSVSENNATAAYQLLLASLWSNTAAITSITLTPASGNWVQYSTAYLYGIKNS